MLLFTQDYITLNGPFFHNVYFSSNIPTTFFNKSLLSTPIHTLTPIFNVYFSVCQS